MADVYVATGCSLNWGLGNIDADLIFVVESDPPMEIPISFPFPVLGTIGILTALFDEYGSQTIELEWVETD